MRYLGIDYGLRKIGLAISEGQIASIFDVIEIKGLDDALLKIKQIIKEEEIDRVVIGISEGKSGEAAKRFANLLKKEIEVIEVDETLTSQDAKAMMIKLNVGREKRKKEDAYSAALILQNFLDTLS